MPGVAGATPHAENEQPSATRTSFDQNINHPVDLDLIYTLGHRGNFFVVAVCVVAHSHCASLQVSVRLGKPFGRANFIKPTSDLITGELAVRRQFGIHVPEIE